MNNKIITLTVVAALSAFGLTGCNIVHKPDINGSEHQPLLHGWTFEQAGEFWLQSALDDDLNSESPMTAEQLARLDDENIRVNLPLAPESTNPQPRQKTIYRQQDTGGFLTFHSHGDTLMADVLLKEMMYFDQDTTLTCYVQQRGRGIYTLYYIANRGTRAYPDGHKRAVAAVIAVHPGSDSLTICRGNQIGPAYICEKVKR